MGIISSAISTNPSPNATSATNPSDTSGVTPLNANPNATTVSGATALPTSTTDPTAATAPTSAVAGTTSIPAASLTANATQAAGYTPATAAPVTNWNVTPNQTVAGQTQSLIADNSPIIQQARTKALEQANGSGLLNSSMAITAGQSAAYQAALPIAQADAATNSKAAGYNADQANQLNTFNTAQSNTASAANAASVNALNLSDLARQTQVQIDTMDNASKITAQQMQNNNAQLLQSNAAASQLFSTASSAINNITQNANMDSAAKTAASAQVWGNLQGQLNALGATSSLNLASIINGNPYAAGGYEVPTSRSTSDQMTQLQIQMAQRQQDAASQQAQIPIAQGGTRNNGNTSADGA
jgi:hypothetical protein